MLTVHHWCTFQVVDKMVVTGSTDCTACAFLLNSYQPPVHFTAHKKTVICMKAVDGMRTYNFCTGVNVNRYALQQKFSEVCPYRPAGRDGVSTHLCQLSSVRHFSPDIFPDRSSRTIFLPTQVISSPTVSVCEMWMLMLTWLPV